MVPGVGRQRHLRLRPHPAAGERLLHRHARRRPSAARCTSATSTPTATPTSSRATSACRARPSSTRSAGTTTACRPSAACRTTSASAATRRCPTTPTSPRRRSRTPSDRSPISRPNFIELCEQLVVEDEKAFEALWRQLGLSVQWNPTYTTIGDHSRTVSQRAFLRNFARGEAYLSEAPTLWDVTFQTAVAQAELEARDYPGAYHRVAFHRPDGTPIHIETTRPELIPSVVALIAHPDDERYQDVFGTTVTSPVFGVEIPVLAHHAAEPDKGAGIAMCCTFGDLTDVMWWRELEPPGPHGRRPRRPPGPRDARVARRRARRDGVRRDGRQDDLQRPRGDGRAAPRVGRPRRRAEGDPADGELLREGRQAARDRRHPPVVHQATAARTRRSARRCWSAARRSPGSPPT